MATIELYANKINRIPGLVTGIRNETSNLKSELMTLKTKVQSINQNICNVDDVMASISASTQTQGDKIAALNNLAEDVKQFALDAERADRNVADTVNQNKEDFYEKYSYLKPFWEKNLFEQMADVGGFLLDSAVEWCQEHWEEILGTIAVILGAAIAIVFVVISGGTTLVPTLMVILTTLGMASGTALTVATTLSLVVAVLSIGTTVVSTSLNIVDLWCDMSGNQTFQDWKNGMNWASVIINCIYSIGDVANIFRGVGNNILKEYGSNYFLVSGSKGNIWNAKKYDFGLVKNASVFWGGIDKSGGKYVAPNLVKHNGRTLVETLFAQNGVLKIEIPRRIDEFSVGYGILSGVLGVNSFVDILSDGNKQ